MFIIEDMTENMKGKIKSTFDSNARGSHWISESPRLPCQPSGTRLTS